jgi:hypothetical protein
VHCAVALELLDRVQALDGAYKEQYATRANVLLRLGDCTGCLRAAQHSLQLDASYQPARVHFTIGLAWIGLDKPAEGVAHLKLAQTLDPKLQPTIQGVLDAMPDAMKAVANSPPAGDAAAATAEAAAASDSTAAAAPDSANAKPNSSH